MNTPAGFEKCLTFINTQLQPPGEPGSHPAGTGPKRAVTISRQSGCGAHVVSEKLAQYLQSRSPKDAPPWTVFDRNLVEKVLQDHHLPERLAKFMPEDRVSEIDDIMNQLFGLHPSSETLVEQTSETILRLAELGNVIILGRGGNIITAQLPQVLHVRLVGSMELRLNHMLVFDKLNRKDALARIEREDGGRGRYLKRYFGKDINDPLQYHLVINTDWVTLRQAAAMVGELALNRNAARSTTPAKVAA
jgi:cytidylate kinase